MNPAFPKVSYINDKAVELGAITPTEEVRRTAGRAWPRVQNAALASCAYGWARVRLRWGRGRREAARDAVMRQLAEALARGSEAEAEKERLARWAELRRTLGRTRRRRDEGAERAALAEAGAEAARVLGQTPYGEQVTGALGLLDGRLMEMATGEGKTLTLAIASVPVALSGRRHFVLTANEYLAGRDAATMEPLYRACGVTVGVVTGGMAAEARRQAYAAEVVYTTARELAADLLRDRLHYGPLRAGERRLVRQLLAGGAGTAAGVVLRGIESVFVDEADYVMLDEAVTPLIISAPKPDPLLETLVREVLPWARGMVAGRDFLVARRERRVELTAAGVAGCQDAWAPRHAVLQAPRRRVEWVRQALVALHGMERDRDYLVRDGQVQIIDQGLGRTQPDRSWSHGLHQLVELKEGVPLTPPTRAIAGISFQQFFRWVPRVAGMSGTLAENAGEFHRLYGLNVERVPLHRPDRRRVVPTRWYTTAEEKFQAVAQRVGELHDAGHPVLIGTLSVQVSERLAGHLRQAGVPFRLLHAAQDAAEAEVIAAAGEVGAVTVATNMAGRGVDIRVAAAAQVQGGLGVLQIERNPARRIDRQLHGRCARQGEPGWVEVFSSADEALAGWGGLLPGRDASVAWNQRRREHRAQGERVALLRRDRWWSDALGG